MEITKSGWSGGPYAIPDENSRHPIDKDTKKIFSTLQTTTQGDVDKIIKQISDSPLAEEKEKEKEGIFSAKTIGRFSGDLIGRTHGAAISNTLVEKIIKSVSKQFVGSGGAYILAEVGKLSITPILMQYMPSILGLAGGFTAPLAIGIVSYLLTKNSKENPVKITHEEIQKFGKNFRRSAWQIIKNEIYQNLLSFKTREEVANYLDRLIIHRQPLNDSSEGTSEDRFKLFHLDTVILADGTVMKPEDRKEFYDLLSAYADPIDTSSSTKSSLKKFVHLISDHMANAAMQIDKERKFENHFIRCDDGIYCLNNGEAIDQEKANTLFKLKDERNQLQAQIAEIQSDFDNIQLLLIEDIKKEINDRSEKIKKLIKTSVEGTDGFTMLVPTVDEILQHSNNDEIRDQIQKLQKDIKESNRILSLILSPIITLYDKDLGELTNKTSEDYQNEQAEFSLEEKISEYLEENKKLQKEYELKESKIKEFSDLFITIKIKKEDPKDHSKGKEKEQEGCLTSKDLIVEDN